MTRKQTLIKALVWRITIAIPLGILFTYLYFGELYKSIQFMLFMNIFFTFLYYAYDRFWFTRVLLYGHRPKV